MLGNRRSRQTPVGCLLVVFGPVAFVYGWAAMLGAAFGDGSDGWATALFLSGLLAFPVGLALIVAGRRR